MPRHADAERWRNTPTGVGKTRSHPGRHGGQRKHPHGRGEDRSFLRHAQTPAETPPRAWGRQRDVEAARCGTGNTPTGVGKTRRWCRCRSRPWKHPHGRGEDASGPQVWNSSTETPPRAWGRPRREGPPRMGQGNTPTGVGKTIAWATYRLYRRKHPHGRGEDTFIPSSVDDNLETPPRAWGRLTHPASFAMAMRKHPHGRGEDRRAGRC